MRTAKSFATQEKSRSLLHWQGAGGARAFPWCLYLGAFKEKTWVRGPLRVSKATLPLPVNFFQVALVGNDVTWQKWKAGKHTHKFPKGPEWRSRHTWLLLIMPLMTSLRRISDNIAAFKPWMRNPLVLAESELPAWGLACPSSEPNIEPMPLPRWGKSPSKTPFFKDLVLAKYDISLFHPLNGFHRHTQNAKADPRNRAVLEKAWRARGVRTLPAAARLPVSN